MTPPPPLIFQISKFKSKNLENKMFMSGACLFFWNADANTELRTYPGLEIADEFLIFFRTTVGRLLVKHEKPA